MTRKQKQEINGIGPASTISRAKREPRESRFAPKGKEQRPQLKSVTERIKEKNK